MAILGKFKQQPADVLDYEFDYALWLADRDDSVKTQEVVSELVSGEGPDIDVSDVIESEGIVRYFASGGVDGSKHKVTCTVVTNNHPPRTKQTEMIISVKET